MDGEIKFEEWVIALETLKVKLSSKDQLLVFKSLDQGRKGFLDYNDFCNLSDERRMKIDPAAAMLREYAQTGKVLTKTGLKQTRSPSRKAQERRGSAGSAMQAHKTNEKTDLEQYLDSMRLTDLEMLQKERRSTKNLEGGPRVYGQMSPLGKPKPF